MWTAYVAHGLDFENFHRTLYDKLTKFGSCRSSRTDTVKNMMLLSPPKSTLATLLILAGDLLHILDTVTDLSLAKNMYDSSRKEIKNGVMQVTHHYNLCFVWICLATFGPYIVQYSSQMSMMYQKGIFDESRFEKFTFRKKAFLVL